MKRDSLCVHIKNSNLKVDDVGNKAYNLSKISSIVNVPDGFVITSKAYDNFIKYNKLGSIIINTENSLMKHEISVDKTFVILKEHFQKAELDPDLSPISFLLGLWVSL